MAEKETGKNTVIPVKQRDLLFYDYSFDSYVLRFCIGENMIYGIYVKSEADAKPGFPDTLPHYMSAGYEELASLIKKQFDSYFSGKKTLFDLPLVLSGTDFQMKVWEKMAEIPYGEVVSYRELASTAGNPAAARAVAGACRANLFPVVIPCHRVIASDGSIGGYSGKKRLVDFKKKLLLIEGVKKGKWLE